MTKSHLLHRFGNPFWLFPIQAHGPPCFDRAEATAACADAPEDHEGGGFMAPALSNIWAACLFADGVEFFAAHEVSEVVVVFSFGRAHFEPFGAALRNDGRHGCFPVLDVKMKVDELVAFPEGR